MKRYPWMSVALVLSLMLLVLPVWGAAPPADPPAGSRAVDRGSLAAPQDGPAAPITVAAPPNATNLTPAEAGTWQPGPFPPSTFQYARHDGAFVPGPESEPWANKIYFPGGRTSPGTESPNIWMFDPVTETYTDTGADIYEDVSNYNANLILDDGTGRGPAIYIVGGTDKDHGGINIGTVQRYYPQGNVVEALPAPDNWNGMVGGVRVACMGTAVVNDVIYVYGGWQSSVSPYFSAETWAFDPNQPSGSRWTNLGVPLHTPRSYLNSAVQGTKIYAIGGVGSYAGGELDPVATVEVLDTTNLAAGWTLLAPMPAAGGEGRGYGFESDTLAVNAPWAGKLYVVAPNDWPDVSTEVLEYDIAANTWDNTFPELPTARADMAGTYVPLCTPDPNDGLPGMWTFGGRINTSCDPPLGPTEYYPMSCYSQCSVLVVDDDWDFDDGRVPNDGGRPYYTSTLEYLGFGYGLWDTVSMGTPTAGDMAPYDVVIWFTGYDFMQAIGPAEQTELIAYLAAGGNLFASAEDQEYANPGGSFIRSYMGVDSVTQEVALRGVTGNATDPLFAGLGPYVMARPDQWAVYWPSGSAEGPWDDQVYAQAGSFEPLVYSDNGEPNATRYDGGGFKTVYLGFPFEWLPDLEDRAELMGTVLQDWFGCELPCIGVAGVAVDGPPELPLGESGTFTATVEPGHATEPVEIAWNNGTTGTTAIYDWGEPGWHTVAVTATNCYGGAAVTGTLEVLVTCDAVTGATISGPVDLALGEPGAYVVAVEPLSATQPVDVMWSNGATTTSTVYSFATPGWHTVSVTVTNCAGTSVVVDMFEVLVTCDAVTGAAISGPAELALGEPGTYVVAVEPPTATLPVDVLWSNGATTTSTVYSFATPGVHTVAVTVTNCAGTAVVVETVNVLSCDALTGATISGPAELILNDPGGYQVALDPPTATQPVDVLWSNGATTTSTVYSFSGLGLHTLAVTATNCLGHAVVTDTFDVAVTCDALTGIALSGPTELLMGEDGTYQVSVEPPTATLPIDFVWSSGVTGTSAVYSWPVPGDYTVVVTASNCLGTAVLSDRLVVNVRQPTNYVYLPIVIKGFGP